MEVTEEEYQHYYRPWWQEKKRELALKVFGERVPVSEFAKNRGELRTTVSSRKMTVLELELGRNTTIPD